MLSSAGRTAQRPQAHAPALQAAADEKLRGTVEAQAASLAELEQRHSAAAKLAAALERQLRHSAATAQRELGKRDEAADDLRRQLEEKEKELKHALLRVRAAVAHTHLAHAALIS